LQWSMVADVIQQLLVGGVVGIGVGYLGRGLVRYFLLAVPGLYAVLSLGLALFAYGSATLLTGSGFLAVYIAAIVFGNGAIPHRSNLIHVHDALAWLAQVVMFLMLGLLVFPLKLVPVAPGGLALGLYLALVARPLVVTVCLLPFRFQAREIAGIAWVGLRGAMPIILATIPVLSVEGQGPAMRDVLNVFDYVFFIVVVGAIVPGTLVRWVTRVLGLQETRSPAPPAVVSIDGSVRLHTAPLPVLIEQDSPAAGRMLRELDLPADATVMLRVRNDRSIAPRGTTRCEVGDYAVVLCPEASIHRVRACLTGAPDSSVSSA